MTRGWLLAVGGWTLPELAEAAHRRGLRLAVALPREEAARVAAEGAFDRLLPIDLDAPPETLLRAILAQDAESPLAGIVPLLEAGLAAAALAARRLRLPGPTPAAVAATSNKLRMRETLARAGLGQVRCAECISPADVEAFRCAVGGPIVVKPRSGAGSDGVSRVDATAEVDGAFRLASSARGADGVIAEELVDGPEVSLEGYVHRGRVFPVAVTDKQSDARFLEIGHAQPSRHPADAQAAAWDLVARVTKALGIDQVLCHTEVRLSGRGPVLIETHTRLGGGRIPHLTSVTTGVDLAAVGVALALGEEPEAVPRPTGRAAAVAFLPGRAGRVRSVHVPDPPAGVTSLTVSPFVRTGAQLSARSASWSRLAQAVAIDASPDAALAAARAALSTVRIEVEPDPPRPAPAAPLRVLLVGGASQPELGRAARLRGFSTHLLVADDHGPDASERDAFDRVESIPVGQSQALLRRILDIHRETPLAAIVPVLQYALVPAALAARRLRLPGPSAAAVERTTDKRRMRAVLEAAGLGQLRYASCETAADVESFRRACAGPIIVKPRCGSGSDGVARVDAPDQVEAAFALARDGGGALGVLCEEMAVGPEVSLEGYVAHGRFVPVAVTDKVSDARFLELGHSQPTRHRFADQAAAWALAERILTALEVTHAVFHVEMRLTPRGPVLIEAHPRMGGDSIHALTALTTGVQLCEVALALALGEDPDVAPRPSGRSAAIAFLPPSATATGLRMPPLVPGDDIVSARSLAGTSPGRRAARSASWCRLAQAIAIGDTPEEALAAAREHLAHVRIEEEEAPVAHRPLLPQGARK